MTCSKPKWENSLECNRVDCKRQDWTHRRSSCHPRKTKGHAGNEKTLAVSSAARNLGPATRTPQNSSAFQGNSTLQAVACGPPHAPPAWHRRVVALLAVGCPSMASLHGRTQCCVALLSGAVAFFACSPGFFGRELVGIAAFMGRSATLCSDLTLAGSVHGGKTPFGGFAVFLSAVRSAAGFGMGTGTAC